MSKFRNILVVVKQTPYEQYLQLKNQGLAPVALRWARLKNRYEVHRSCVEDVTKTLQSLDVSYNVIGREEMHRGILLGKDLVVTVGGDGTTLSTSCFLDDSIPVLGVNSDPTRPEDQIVTKVRDERRSRGALCALSATDVESRLPSIIFGESTPKQRSRIQCIVKSTYTETRLPPALNDVLVAHPSPAAVSRFRLTLKHLENDYDASFQAKSGSIMSNTGPNIFSYNCWSSGIWVSTATGSTAAMHAAGGHQMDLNSTNLQYKVREHLLEKDEDELFDKTGHGEFTPEEMIHIRWNSQFGCVFVDGSHTTHDLQLGDEITIEGHAPMLNLF